MPRSRKRSSKPKFRQRLFVVDRKPQIDDGSDESPTKDPGGIKIEAFSSDDDEVTEQVTQAKKIMRVSIKEEPCNNLDSYSPMSSYENKHDQLNMISIKESPSSHVFSTPKKESSEDYEITEFPTPTDSGWSQVIREDEEGERECSKTPELRRTIARCTQDSEYDITQYCSPTATQTRHLKYTIDHQISLYLTSVQLHVVIYYMYSTPEFKRVLVRDADMIFSLIDVPRMLDPDSLNVGRTLILKNVGVGSKVTVSSWSPLFSVIWTLGSQQRFYYSLFWTAITTAEEIQSRFLDYQPHEPLILSLSDIKNKEIGPEDQRVSVTGIVQQVTKAGFYIFSAWESLRIITLQSFGKLSPTYQGKEVTLHFLRVYRDLCTMDQFSDIELN